MGGCLCFGGYPFFGSFKGKPKLIFRHFVCSPILIQTHISPFAVPQAPLNSACWSPAAWARLMVLSKVSIASFVSCKPRDTSKLLRVLSHGHAHLLISLKEEHTTEKPEQSESSDTWILPHLERAHLRHGHHTTMGKLWHNIESVPCLEGTISQRSSHVQLSPLNAWPLFV